jgi:hypothetical protein
MTLLASLVIVAAACTSAAASQPSLQCGAQQSEWHLTETRARTSQIFTNNLIKRFCALQTGDLGRPVKRVEIQGASTWEETALVLTAAATAAYIQDQPMQMHGTLPDAISPGKGSCDMHLGCLFEVTVPAETSSAPSEVWDSQRLINHYLRGAGILWLRSRTSAVSGCDLAAAFVSLYLQPSGTFRNYLDDIMKNIRVSEPGETHPRKVLVMNGESVHISLQQLQVVLQQDVGAEVWILGGTNYSRALLDFADAREAVHALDLSALPPGVRTAVSAFVLAHGTHYLGDLEPLWVKVGLLLGLAKYGSFPVIHAGTSRWNDAYGFASCTAEEFNAHMRVATGVRHLGGWLSKSRLLLGHAAATSTHLSTAQMAVCLTHGSHHKCD